MCEQLVLLSRQGPERYVMCCEHGVTHLIWEHVSIRIPTKKLARIAKELHDASLLAAQYRIASNYDVTVICNQHDQFQVWILAGGIHLMPDDFKQFVEMVQNAGKHNLARAATENTAQSPECKIKRFRVPPNLYSAN